MLPLAVPFILYVFVSLPGVQRALAQRAEEELTSLLGTEVGIGSVEIAPFNRLVLKDVSVSDGRGIEALKVGHLGAGVSLFESLWGHRWVITYVELIDLDARLYRPTAGSPLNIQPIIDRFDKGGDKGPKNFDLAVNLLVIRRSALSYDVNDAPAPVEGRFDVNHIKISDFQADICAPFISDSHIEAQIKRLLATERSGLSLKEFTADVSINPEEMRIGNFTIELDHSRIAFNDIVTVSPLNPDFNFRTALVSSIETLPDTYLQISDLNPFTGNLADIDVKVDIALELSGTLDSIGLRRVDFELPERNARFSGHGRVMNLSRGKDSLSIEINRLNLVTNLPRAIGYMANSSGQLSKLYQKLEPLSPLGDINILGDFRLTPRSLDFIGSFDSDCGNLDIDCNLYRRENNAPLEIFGNVSSLGFSPSQLDKSIAPLTNIDFDGEVNLSIAPKGMIEGHVGFYVDLVEWNGHSFSDISAEADFGDGRVDGRIVSLSPTLDFNIAGGGDLKGANPLTEFFAEVKNVNLSPFVKSGKYRNYNLAVDIDASFHGRSPDSLDGWLKLENIEFGAQGEKSLSLSSIEIEAAKSDSIRSLTLRSPQADADIRGNFSYKTVIENLKGIIAGVYPSLLPSIEEEKPSAVFDINLDLKVKEDTTLSRFFNLPVEMIYPVTLKSFAKGGEDASIGLDIDMPYLKNKDKLIEESRLSMLIDGVTRRGELVAHTSLPTKNGMLSLNLNSSGHVDSVQADISWIVDRQAQFKGNFDFSTIFKRSDDTGDLITDIEINPSKMVFNDSAWTVNPGAVHIAPGRISVDNISGGRDGQYLSINGVASADSADRLVLKLDHIDLDYIFETLNISDAVQFGGRATGDFYGFRLLSKEPVLYTPRLYVEGLKYNGCVMGDGDIKSYWDHADKSINIAAVIKQANGQRSVIDGFIRPTTEELDFNFEAKSAPVGFMAPFMSAFTSKIDGEVSGDAHLFGTFKDLDMTGDILVKDLSMKLDFTNTVYTTTDSVHITPGLIKFEDVTLSDRDGKTAKLSGYVTHKYFHDPTFRFNVTDARDFLVYDVGENQTEDPWYGCIYGNGRASVTGVPGHVDINVAMSTAPKSTFTFVLTDAEQALDYTFITLRDRDKAAKDSIAALDPTPKIVRELRERVKKQEDGEASVYSMTFEVDITPTATMNLIMDPIGGDKITAHGSGHVRMAYSSDGDLRMYGDYTISRGTYNFTLQDIIIKDFTIREGSKISFLGDPYAAQLDITASYSVNANLSDLDESFLEDRELNRTNVPVDALMMVKGDMRQPDISFDLEFPTLNRDTYRKVRSIVSTEDMMNRQIIYLLALNKFYTPDYMTATHGNELVSVASSTISSRIGAMLGQLSNNWSIAPAIRSDRGDFSDVEVDVALSSHLLNNRLLFNGNFGYRDKSLNNNSFIGDFDIRYLLNRSGSIQLKAYNRYNDQNYYLKSALTTQGVGIVFKRDFDNIFSFLRRKKKDDKGKKSDENDGKVPADSIEKVKTDSVSVTF